MAIVAQGEALGSGNPKLRFFLQINGLAADPTTVTFAIFNPSLVQVSPGSGTTSATKITTGSYVATFTMPSGTTGVFQIRWYYTLNSSDVQRTYKMEFQVT